MQSLLLGRAIGQDLGQRSDSSRPSPAEFTACPIADGETVFIQQCHQLLQRKLVPLNLQSAGIIPAVRGSPTNAVDGAQHIGFPELRGGAADFVPAAGIDHDQAAVRILQYIGGVKVKVVTDDQLTVLRGKTSATDCQLVA